MEFDMEFDLHIHSKYSFDSLLDPKKILKVAKKKGLNGIAITDHGTIKGGIMALNIAKNEDFFIIIGTEIKTEIGDIMGLFLNEEIQSRISFEVLDEIKDKGGIAVLPHPYKRAKNISEEILNRIDAIEGFNARGEGIDSQSKNFMACELAKLKNKPLTAGSDAHFYFEIGRGKCVVNDISDLEEFRKMILNRKTKISGVNTSLYVEPMSQIIRMIKLKRFYLIYNISFQIGAITVFQINKFFKTNIRDLRFS